MQKDNPVKKKVLFLSAWYPNRYDPMPGLFVKRHAQTMSSAYQVAVLYTHAVDELPKTYELQSSLHDDVFTITVYYQKIKKTLPILNHGLKLWRFFKAHLLGFHEIQKHFGLPHLVHVNILTRVGIFALYLKIRYGISYVITEHWTRYQPEHHTYNGLIRKIITTIVVKKSSGISVVSHNLKAMMNQCHIYHPHFLIINNAVCDSFFNPPITSVQSGPTIFTHISCFDNNAKNNIGIVRAVYELSKSRKDFLCLMVGEGSDWQATRQLALSLGLKDNTIQFLGLKEGKELIKIYHQSAFTVLFSNYENMPVVISESFACGKPVISTNVGGIAEIITPSTGILVKAGNESELTQAIDHMLDHHTDYNPDDIKKFALENFSNEAVAKQISALYAYAINS